MSEYGDMTLDQYRDALASNDPTPGGGSASAVALSQGAALAIMVCNLTHGKEKWKDGWGDAEACRNIASPLLELGHQLAMDDAKSFDDVMSAYKLPRNSDEERLSRSMAIQNATLNAAMVPMETANRAYELLRCYPPSPAQGMQMQSQMLALRVFWSVQHARVLYSMSKSTLIHYQMISVVS